MNTFNVTSIKTRRADNRDMSRDNVELWELFSMTTFTFPGLDLFNICRYGLLKRPEDQNRQKH